MEGFVGGLRCCFGHGVILFLLYPTAASLVRFLSGPSLPSCVSGSAQALDSGELWRM
jgi:hypothetical protein